jgi:hypothetical protein
VALVVLRSTTTRVEQELGKHYVFVAAMIAFLIVDKPAKAHQSLFHLLVTIEPVLLSRAKVRDPAISQFLRCVIQAKVFAIGQRVMVDGRLNKVSGNIAFVIAAMIR